MRPRPGRAARGERPGERRPERTPWWLLLLSGLFLALIAVLVAASLLRPEPPPQFAPGEQSRHAGPDGSVWGQVTLDARDPGRWIFFSFERGTVGAPDDGWDLAARRFRLVANGGAELPGAGGARELGDLPLEVVGELPAEGYVATRGTLAGNPANPALEHWYSYGFVTHLLRPRPTTFALRTADGRYAAIRILSYYCPGAEPGCVTFAYLWHPAGDRGASSPGPEGRSAPGPEERTGRQPG